MLTKSQFNDHVHGDRDLLAVAHVRWTTLQQIYEDYVRLRPKLGLVALLVSEPLGQLEMVQSLKMRVKDPLHLVAKVVRREREEYGLRISVENYRTHITDLVGVRAMHVTKGEWKPIHDFLVSTFRVSGPPVAYVRLGDTNGCTQAYRARGCEVREHSAGYRSVHYVVQIELDGVVYPVEIQVRTLLEEAWSEIDHALRYPYRNGDGRLERCMTALSMLVGLGDTLASEARSHGDDGARADLEAQSLQVERAQRDIIARSMVFIEGNGWPSYRWGEAS